MLTVVTGPPCSGKSTYVREHAQPGDVVIDFDLICQALGSPNPHDHPDAVRHVAISMRREGIVAAIRAHRRGAAVWIVDTHATKRARMYEEADAQIVTLVVDSAELHHRASRERPALWHRLIDDHLATQSVTTSRSW